MLKRKAYDKLIEWKKQDNKKALCIIGARQVGKTTLVREFAKEYYENFIEINFYEEPNAVKIFSGNLDVQTIITNLTAYTRKPMEPHKTLVLFDEIQKYPNIRTAMKFLVADGRFDYIESGSLLGVNFKEVVSFPVGFEEMYRMYPMDFEEFLWANGVQQSTIDYLKRAYDTLTPVSDSVHDTMKKLFYTYMVVGGMPEAVQIYVNSHDIAKVIHFQKEIITQYSHDISQYVESNSNKQRIKAIYDAIPSQLNDKKRRFYVNSLDKNAKLNRYENSFKWLSDAGVALPCYNVTAPQPPLKLNEKHSLFKLFMADIGLLCAACMENIQFDILNGNLEINMGSILENVMAQELQSKGFEIYYYDSSKLGEVDFVIQNGIEIELLEIKSGKDYKKHKALDHILSVSEWKFKKATVFCKDNVQLEDNITYMPWYMIMFVKPYEQPDKMIYEIDLSGLNI
ncbi:ATP-binding protein [Floccifex sp.]|uniref:ATP-binding protein n=1 Tax=Floccifex sp. TaxID=2815810 RepID=UPI003F0921E4